MKGERKFEAHVHVTLKKGVLDPQGVTVQSAVGALGYRNILDVRVGKYIIVSLEASGPETAQAQADEISRRVLTNPVLEDYTIEVREVAGQCAGE